MKQLFGTDGVRGLANKELTPELAYRLGKAACIVLGRGEEHPLFVIGRDTRLSCQMLENALTAGIMNQGGKVISLGIIPTPAVAVLTRYYNATSGVVISASHNPYYDNGIKFFNESGLKLADEIEEEIEDVIINKRYPSECLTHDKVGTQKSVRNAADLYIAFLLDNIPKMTLEGIKIVLDCSNGSTYLAAPEIFTKLGATIKVISGHPNGTNINENCGSTHISNLESEVLHETADLGLAFDGDGDRLIAVDENGKEINGDGIMYLCAKYLKDNKMLHKNTVVLTQMSNMGLKIALQQEDIDIIETQVGDRYILQKMIEHGYNFGGEQSGHIIYSNINTTGDGIASALLLCLILKKYNQPLSHLVANFITYPQILVNVRVEAEKKMLYRESKQIENAVKALNQKYAGTGRVLLRHSGTEPLVRVMIEGKDSQQIYDDATQLANLIAEISK